MTKQNKRKCGDCRECCIVLEVDAMRKEADEPCRHLCAAGCAVYSQRPASCKEFTCAWREGMLGRRDSPHLSHMVIWVTEMISPNGKRLQTVQCNVRKGAKRHRKTMRYLRSISYAMSVNIIQAGKCELLSLGKSIVQWDQGDFVNLDCNSAGKITSGKVVPRDKVLLTEDEADRWETMNRNALEVIETDPIYRREQLNYLEQKLNGRL